MKKEILIEQMPIEQFIDYICDKVDLAPKRDRFETDSPNIVLDQRPQMEATYSS